MARLPISDAGPACAAGGEGLRRVSGAVAIAKAPAAEVVIDEAVVRRLLLAQHADLAERPLRIVAAGWDDVLDEKR
jgi:hypothetical protein